jgi:polar amino acid transport system substrate-binding protein
MLGISVRALRRTGLVAILTSTLLLGGGALAHTAVAQNAATDDQGVGIGDFTFTPADTWVLAGKSVTWTNPIDPVEHTTTAVDGTWDSGPIATGDQFTFAFDTPGDYPYYCSIHPQMTATVHVRATAAELPLAPLARVERLADMVPPDVRAKGALQIATDATYAPNEFIDPADGQIKGWDIDFANAISTALDLPFVISNADFTSIIPNLGSRYDASFASFTPTAEREKTVDFVTYYQAGEAWFTRVGGPNVASALDMCGKTVAVQTGTVEESDAWGFMGKKPDGSAIPGDKDNCAANGRPPITVHSFVKQTEANADLVGGRADVGWADSPVADYQVKLLPDQLNLAGSPCSVAPYGIALPKGSGMIPVFTEAVKWLIDNGYYDQILKKWNVADGAIKSSAVALNNNNTIGPTCVPSY